MNDTNLPELYQQARRHLSRRDEKLKALIKRIGDCTLQLNSAGFVVLVRAIISQLISTAAAKTISGRLDSLVGDAGITPASILALDEQRLRSVGLSGSKARAVRDLAERTSDGRLPVDALPTMSDEEAMTRLTEVYGIGVWTAEMYLIFSLGRMDVLPVGDLGLREGVRQLYGLEEMPKKKALVEIAEPWRPYRSIATWYLWRSRGDVPQSK